MVSPSLIALLSLVCCTVPIHSSPTNNTILKGGGGGGGGKGGSSAPRVVPHIVDPIVVAPKAIASTPEVEDPAVAVVPKAGAAATVPAASVPTAGAANTPSAASQSVAPAVVPAYRLVTSDVTGAFFFSNICFTFFQPLGLAPDVGHYVFQLVVSPLDRSYRI